MASMERRAAAVVADDDCAAIADLRKEIVRLRQQEEKLFAYLREKVDHLLQVMGTLPLQPEELDNETLLSLDPIGILGDCFSQVLEHLQKTNEDLAVARDEIQAVFDSAGAGILVVDGKRRIRAYNRMSRDLFFPEATEVIGHPCCELVCDPYMPPEDCIFDRVAAARKKLEQTCFSSQGKYFYVVGTPIMDRSGEIALTVLVYTDITGRKLAEEELARSEARYRDLFENANDLIQSVGTDGKLLFANNAWQKAMGYSADEVPTLHFRRIVHPASLDRCQEHFRQLLGGESVPRLEATFITREGMPIEVEGSVNCLRENGQVVATRGIFRDITARKRAEAALRESEERFRSLYEQSRAAEARIQQLAFFDSLTGLPNRTLLQDRLDQSLVQARREGQQVGVVFLDLDHFKSINDTLGHGIGDELLRAIAARLRKCVRQSDTVARLGGDEFVILLTAVQDLMNVTRVARKILDVFATPTRLAGHDLYTTASIGIALYPGDGKSADVLLKNADTAMYKAKERGRNAFQFYSPDMNAQALERLLLGTDLHRAMERGEFSLHYQPQLCIATGRLIGMEALMRWTHPELGTIPPATFIPLAEETGAIFPLGRWALESACARSRQWSELGFSDLKLAVNLSGRQFRQEVVVALVREALEKTGLAAGQLELELTEGMLMEGGRSTGVMLSTLKEMGVQLAIDDFGTGYSSLACLKQFPIDRVKIDTSFIREIPVSANDAAIAEAVIALAHSLKIKVVAEGVETREQFAFLRERGCDEMQGYLFRPALDEDNLERFLAERRADDNCLTGLGPDGTQG